MNDVNPELIKRIAQVEKALHMMGGTHSFPDLMNMIATGQMQSFVAGKSWAITQIFDFPQKRVCDIFLAMGDMPDMMALHDMIIAFAKEHDCKLVRAFGRKGWAVFADPNGWQISANVYLKEIA